MLSAAAYITYGWLLAYGVGSGGTSFGSFEPNTGDRFRVAARVAAGSPTIAVLLVLGVAVAFLSVALWERTRSSGVDITSAALVLLAFLGIVVTVMSVGLLVSPGRST